MSTPLPKYDFHIAENAAEPSCVVYNTHTGKTIITLPLSEERLAEDLVNKLNVLFPQMERAPRAEYSVIPGAPKPL